MPYRVTAATTLQVESDRVQSILTMSRYRGVVWTATQVRDVLVEAGLACSNAELQAIAAELVRRGVLEQVA